MKKKTVKTEARYIPIYDYDYDFANSAKEMVKAVKDSINLSDDDIFGALLVEKFAQGQNVRFVSKAELLTMLPKPKAKKTPSKAAIKKQIDKTLAKQKVKPVVIAKAKVNAKPKTVAIAKPKVNKKPAKAPAKVVKKAKVKSKK